MPPMLQAIDHIHVFVADRAASEQWYARVMGFHRVAGLEFWSADGGPLTIADPEASIHLALFERPAEKCRSTIALSTTASGFLAWRSHLADALGGSVRIEDHAVSWSLYFADPDGNPYEITTYDYAAVAVQLESSG